MAKVNALKPDTKGRKKRNTFNEDEDLDTPFSMENLKQVLKYIGRYKVKLIISLLLSAIGSVVGLIGPMILEEAINVAIPAAHFNYLYLLGAAYLGTIAVNLGFNAIRTVIVAKVTQNLIYDIRKDLFEHLQELPFSYYDSRPHGKILVRVIHYVNNVSDVLSNGVLNMIIEVVNIIFIIVFMLMVNVPISFVVFSGLPVIIGFIFFIKPRQRKAWQQVSNKSSNVNAFMQESIEGVKVTQAFARQEKNEEILDGILKERRKSAIYAFNVSIGVNLIADTIAQAMYCLVYLVGAYFITPMLPFGTLMAMANYSTKFWAPITSIANLYNTFINALAYLERIFETMNEPRVIEDAENAKELPPIKGEVEFKDVVFGYEEGQTILDKVSFKAEKGESIAIVGPTGAGKTTIVNLISRFYNVRSGEVLIDGHDVNDVTLKSLRSQMGIMLQDSFIFSGTIMDNIKYGKLDATDGEIKNACKLLKVDDFVSKMPYKYYTVVKERGGGLSQGQKQLIAFARTLVADPKILVLDEATSSIDTSTEKLVQQGIDILLKGRTSFIIAHRLSTIREADKILVVRDGDIVEQGTHEELMKAESFYAHLYNSQFS